MNKLTIIMVIEIFTLPLGNYFYRAVARCLLLSVRPSHAGILSKRLNIFKLFSPSESDSHTIPVFPYKTEISDGTP